MKISSSFQSAVIALSFLFPCAASLGASVDELMKRGDKYDVSLNPSEALKCYLPVEQMEPKNSDVLLRIARQYRHQMADARSDKDKFRLANRALDYSRRALALAPTDSDANLSMAICYGKALDLYDNREKMDALRQIKSFADRAVALDGKNDLAWYVLGRWNHRVTELSGVKRKLAEVAYGVLPKASNEEAVKCYNKAIHLKPGRCVYYVEMGIACAAMSNAQDAKIYIAKGLSMPSVGKDDPETKKRGKETLAALM